MERVNTFNNLYRKSVDPPPDFPYIIDIELTNCCNLSCRMCSRSLMTRDKGFISEEIFTKINDECKAKETGIRFIRWGEPFLHNRILDFSKKIKDGGLPLHITTNGLLLTEKEISFLTDIELDSIIFSMQGATKKEYAYMRNNKEYDLLIENIRSFIRIRDNKKKPYIALTSTMTERDNFSDIKNFKSFWKNIVDSVSVGVTDMKQSECIIPVTKKYSLCKEPWQKIGIDWDGEVTACCGDYDRYLSIGNVKDTTINDIWNNNVVLDSIRNLLSEKEYRHLALCSKCAPAYGSFAERDK